MSVWPQLLQREAVKLALVGQRVGARELLAECLAAAEDDPKDDPEGDDAERRRRTLVLAATVAMMDALEDLGLA